MKQELIQLAKSQGFKSLVIGESVNSEHSANKDLFYLLWMTELQHWLRSYYSIHVTTSCMNTRLPEYTYTCSVEYNNEREFFKYGLETNEEALEKGLFNALNLTR